MIRDPSDGSVREPQKSAPHVAESLPSGEIDPSVTLDFSGADTNSGLPLASTKPENIARLERSREWLVRYFEARGKC
jgi:hypothetical protein